MRNVRSSWSAPPPPPPTLRATPRPPWPLLPESSCACLLPRLVLVMWSAPLAAPGPNVQWGAKLRLTRRFLPCAVAESLTPQPSAEACWRRCHSTAVLVQPITTSIQRVRVPPWESSDCPGSHIRRARGATLGRESPEVQVPGGPTPRGRGRLVQGREQSLGPQHQANFFFLGTGDHREPPF